MGKTKAEALDSSRWPPAGTMIKAAGANRFQQRPEPPLGLPRLLGPDAEVRRTIRLDRLSSLDYSSAYVRDQTVIEE
ncbi:hypothetical protein [Candidatus Thiodictyon syntrophicum]|jgi:hypothetical protein|uniref:Uncharacterized protein n=1 Tax=Candidatus Thiodictyon syntrophicum TaxID=1166950 RepID=A0A2K8U9S6_9GAMM|nr:hypothetical protein [Candidatus Thiodictyon syntrophicum]AUB82336.1 hypothetical protein THSYN_16200 [Candidatus Thiodictyon syntrophicum]